VRDNGVAFDAKDCKKLRLGDPAGLSVIGKVFPRTRRDGDPATLE